MRSHGWITYRLCFCFGLFVFTTGLQANPTGGNVAAGSASIAGQGTSTVTVNQASNIAIINWQTFSINSGELTQFIQPSAQSAALNRVLGGQTSIINGTLSANGQIYLVNGNGIVVGPNGVVNANAFTASTRDISDADFLSGNLHFTGSSNAGVQNLGKIKALGGDVVLIGKTVDNQGTIETSNGTAGLIAADNVLLAQKNADGSTITISPSTMATSASTSVGVHNSGTITASAAELKAANGNIYALAVQNEGTIRASTVLKQGGHIWLTSDSGTVSNSGILNASASVAGGQGGTVTLKSTTGTASHTGKIIAQGGQGGAGGNAEISGAKIQFSGTVDLTAPGGTMGSLLLDPATLDIMATGGTGTISSGTNSTADSTIDASVIVAALNGANVNLDATTSMTVNTAVDASGNGSGGNLTLTTPTLNLNAGITLFSGSTLSGTAVTVNVGASGLVQNAVDASSTTSAPTINLASGATYDLPNEVLIGKSLTLDGNGAILNGQNSTRVMEIEGTSTGITVNLNGVTLENGNGVGTNLTGNGGGLLIDSDASDFEQATVTINNSTITNNSVTANFDSSGGGIFNIGGNVTITNSTISSNSATGGTNSNAGGIFNTLGATMSVSNSTISGNKADFLGGGIDNTNSTLTVSNSTISGNSAEFGGGIFTSGTELATVNNSTIAGNTVSQSGGAIDASGTTTVTNSTITGNSTNSAFAQAGGGIFISSTGGSLTIGDTIIFGNTYASGESDEENNGGPFVDLGYNLIGRLASNDPFSTGLNDIIFNGLLGSVLQVDGGGHPLLASNGGPTQTVALVMGSPAFKAGGALTGITTPTTDQRGVSRGSTISIGAYDFDPSLVVTTNDDTSTILGVEVGGVLQTSLRDAISFANAGFDSANPTITFDTSVFDGVGTDNTITLTQGELALTANQTITGPTTGVIINANNASRVMEIDGNTSTNGVVVSLNNLTLENGNGTGGTLAGRGGGLFIDGAGGSNKTNVTITDSTITNNSVSGGAGAGIYNDAEGDGQATLTINDSTISNNHIINGGGSGGGIYNDGDNGTAILNITNSTITGNSTNATNSVGGGIYSLGQFGNATVTISNSTITGNSAVGEGAGAANGGGIFQSGSFGLGGSATLTISDTILAGNTYTNGGVGESDYDNGFGTEAFIDGGHNLFGQNGDAGDVPLTNGVNGNILLGGNINTVLAPLGNYGGPTQTMALIIGSPAYLAGGPLGTVTTDQRGQTRGSTISIGAYDATSSLIVNTETDTNVLGAENSSGGQETSLRDAIFYASALSSPTITFDTTVFDGVSTDNTINLALGQLLINSSLTINGPATGVTINAGGNSRVLEIDGIVAGDTVSLSNLTLENGDGYAANGTGLGIANGDDGGGGGLLIYAASGNQATVTISNSTISGNSTALDCNGGGIYNDSESGSATLTITNSTISGNSASVGGGIYNLNVSGTDMLTITNSTISGNSSGSGEGGGIDNLSDGGSATVTITDSTISGNSANDGGGIASSSVNGSATMTITDSAISGNSSDSGGGGGIFNFSESGSATVTISNSTISGNAAKKGGGIANDHFSGSAMVTIINSTVSGNSANKGGGIYNLSTLSTGGSATVTISNSTLSGNSATLAGGGIYNDVISGSATLTIGDSILAGNTLSGSESDYAILGTAALVDNGFNLFGNDGVLTSNGTTDILFTGNINTVLAPLANNGGPTQTMALVTGSVAIGAGGPVGTVTTDQRGVARISPISIGAYEAPANTIPPLGQPGTGFFNFSAQFDANANYNTFFTQSQFWTFDPSLDGWLIPVFSPGNEPHPVYTAFVPGYGPGGKTPGGVIAFGSSFTVNGQGGN